MYDMSRRKFLGSTAVTAGAFSLGNISGCSTPSPEKPTAENIRWQLLDGIDRENIKITDVKITLLSYELPPEEQWIIHWGRWAKEGCVCWKTDSILMEVFTDQGIVGIGGPSQYGGPEVMKKYTEEVIKPSIIGQNPFDIELLSCGSVPLARGARTGWAGIDAALWDIIGKAKNMPVYKLLATDNEPNPYVWTYASAGEIYKSSKWPEDLIEEAFRHRENGFDAFKFRPWIAWQYTTPYFKRHMTLKEYIPILRKLREAVGPDFYLIQTDASSMGLTIEQYLEELCPVLEELNILFLQQPMSNSGDDAIENYAKLNEALPNVLIAGGEGISHRSGFRELIDYDYYDIVQPDCGICGITEAWYIARVAHLKGKLCAPHNWHGGFTTMENASLTAGVPNGYILEYNQTFNPMREGIFKEPLVVKNGHMDLPDRPGFGLEIIDDVEKKFPFLPGDYKAVR
ncbi:mandelate racemase/muconate lactonizing enzyme family protein [Candidatus Latescibacterota bacterium]